jgi:hydrophobic/amphiphilic exporter-1 (mainly G- bacteria), HAE1 family
MQALWTLSTTSSTLQGAFHRQFAITIATATVISAFVSLTLSPALAALLLKPRASKTKQSGVFYTISSPLRWFFTGFNWLFDKLAVGYGFLTARLVRVGLVALLVYAGRIFYAYDLLRTTPTGLIPQLDRGYLIAAFQLPPGASLDRSDKVLRRTGFGPRALEGAAWSVLVSCLRNS